MSDLAALPIIGKNSKQCGECTLCCKLIAVTELLKPANQTCHLCEPGKGCSIYHVRPDGCKSFECLWLMFAQMPEDFRPDKIHAVLQFDAEANFLNVHLDEHIAALPQRLNDWLKIFVSVCKVQVNLIQKGTLWKYDAESNQRIKINEKSDGILVAGN